MIIYLFILCKVYNKESSVRSRHGIDTVTIELKFHTVLKDIPTKTYYADYMSLYKTED